MKSVVDKQIHKFLKLKFEKYPESEILGLVIIEGSRR